MYHSMQVKGNITMLKGNGSAKPYLPD